MTSPRIVIIPYLNYVHILTKTASLDKYNNGSNSNTY